MKLAVLQTSDPQRASKLEKVIRRYLPELGDALMIFSDADEANEWMLMHEPSLLMLERDATALDVAQVQRVRRQWPMMQQLFIPEDIFSDHPANAIFARQATMILSDKRASFTGTTGIASLVPLMQFIGYARLDGQLGVRGEGSELSVIGFTHGQMVYARHGELSGVEALRGLLTLTRGSFRWSVEMGFDANIEYEDGSRLLLELVRHRDEQRWRANGLVEDSSFELAAPAGEIVPAPLKISGVRHVYSSASDAQTASLPARGFIGSFALAQLMDVVQLHLLTQSTGILHVYYGLREAQIHFENGEVVHAVCSSAEGESAFIMVMAVRQGSFMFAPQPVHARTIRASMLNLLLGATSKEGDDDAWSDEGELELFGPTNAERFKQFKERIESGVFEATGKHGRLLQDAPRLDVAAVPEALESLRGVSGFMWSALVQREHGVLHVCSASEAPEAGVIHMALKAMPGLLDATLKASDILEDTMMITPDCYVLSRPLSQHRGAFMVLVLDRKSALLGLARLKLGVVEEALRVALAALEQGVGDA